MTRSRYRVYATPVELARVPLNGARVVESYPSFVVIDLAAEAAHRLARRWPVEQLPGDGGPARTGGRARAAGRVFSPEGGHDYLVTMTGPTKAGWRRAIARAGATIVDPRGARTLLVRGDATAVDRLRGLPFVARVRRYREADRVSPATARRGPPRPGRRPAWHRFGRTSARAGRPGRAAGGTPWEPAAARPSGPVSRDLCDAGRPPAWASRDPDGGGPPGDAPSGR